MNQPWAPELTVVDEALARALIDAQFPELKSTPVRYLGAGWDNTVFRVGEVSFRFPRREVALELLETEARVLPEVAAHLSVPAPVYLGKASEAFPWPFLGQRFIEGKTLCSAGLDSWAHLAEPLGDFLNALHKLSGEHAPPDEYKRTDLEHIRGIIDERAGDRASLVRSVLEQRDGRAREGHIVLCHGDLYARHVVIGARGALSGIIDWGDVHRGDRVRDLATGPLFFEASARERFYARFDVEVSQAEREAAEIVALYSALTGLRYGEDRGDRAMLAIAERALRHLEDGLL